MLERGTSWVVRDTLTCRLVRLYALSALVTPHRYLDWRRRAGVAPAQQAPRAYAPLRKAERVEDFLVEIKRAEYGDSPGSEPKPPFAPLILGRCARVTLFLGLGSTLAFSSLVYANFCHVHVLQPIACSR